MAQNISFKNSRNLTVAGTLWAASPQAIVIMVHGSGSNRFAHGLFTKIAHALQKDNYSVLSFDFSGHGESEDAIFTLKQSIDDVESAMAFAKAQGYTRIALLGHSLGAYACLEAYRPSIETMILLGALTGPVQWKWEELCSPEQVAAMNKTGYISAEINDGLRNTVKIDGNLLNDIQAIAQEEFLPKVTCPILIIHGDVDKQERDLLLFSQKGLTYLSAPSQLKIIPGADHKFLAVVPETIAFMKEWFSKYFPVN